MSEREWDEVGGVNGTGGGGGGGKGTDRMGEKRRKTAMARGDFVRR